MMFENIMAKRLGHLQAVTLEILLGAYLSFRLSVFGFQQLQVPHGIS